MADKEFEAYVQIAVQGVVTIRAENFEEALVKARELVHMHKDATRTLKRVVEGRGASINDTEAYLTGVHDNESGCMYK